METKLKKCRVCGSTKFKTVINLGHQYLQSQFLYKGSNNKVLQKKFLTKLVRCDQKVNKNACGLVQLSITVPKNYLYRNYFYRSGINQTMKTHLKNLHTEIMKMNKEKRLSILDIGCNDGTFLNFFKKKIIKYGIDPSNSMIKNNFNNINFFKDYFPSRNFLKSIGKKKFNIITSIAMFYDLDNPVLFAKKIEYLLKESGIWIFELSYMPQMLKLNSYDTICHEHLEYYNLGVIEKILEKSNLKLAKVSFNKSNGGSIRCYVIKKENFKFENKKDKKFLQLIRTRELNLKLDTDQPYKKFRQNCLKNRNQLRKLIIKLKNKKKIIHLYGASTKGNTILQWCKLNHKLIEFASERNSLKFGSRTLGSNIKIISEEDSRKMKPDYYLVMPWHFKNEIIAREKNFLKKGGKIILPLPKVQTVEINKN